MDKYLFNIFKKYKKGKIVKNSLDLKLNKTFLRIIYMRSVYNDKIIRIRIYVLF